MDAFFDPSQADGATAAPFLKRSSIANLRDQHEDELSPTKPTHRGSNGSTVSLNGMVYPLRMASGANVDSSLVRAPTETRRESGGLHDREQPVDPWSVPASPTASPPASPRKPLGPADLTAAIKLGRFFDALKLYQLQRHVQGLNDGDDPQDAAEELKQFHDKHGKTLLHHACRCANVQVVKWLLFHGVDAMTTCTRKRTAFHEAVSSGTDNALEVLKLLYEYAPRGLMVVDVNGTHVLHLAAIHGRVDIIDWCSGLQTRLRMAITSFSGRNMLHYAAYNGRLRVLQWLLSDENDQFADLSTASLDANGYSILHYAALGGHADTCQWIVLHAPRSGDLQINARTSGGQTALDMAKKPEIRDFLTQVSQPPPVPGALHCIGSDSCSLGISWVMEEPSNSVLADILAPLYYELEFCKRPAALSRGSGLLTMMLMLPTSGVSPYLLKWESVGVLIQPEATEYWLTGLEPETEYLVRMRALNRNGYSGYSCPTVGGDFTTTAIGVHMRQHCAMRSPTDQQHDLGSAFIGTLHLEVLEARHLSVHTPRRKRSSRTSVSNGNNNALATSGSMTSLSRKDAAAQGRYYCVVALELPLREPRRHTFPAVARVLSPTASARSNGKRKHKFMYMVRSEHGTLQEELIKAGSRHAFRHPRFELLTRLRVPEVLGTVLHIEVHHESRYDSVIGTARLSLMDLVRGLPAKLQWLTLSNRGAEPGDGSFGRGELLLRTLFLADGITFLPHPTVPNVFCTTAEGLLNPEPKPTTTTAMAGQLDTRSHVVDALGFRVRAGGRSSRAITSFPRRSYDYYRLLHECLEAQQVRKFVQFHRHCHGSCDDNDLSVNAVLEATATVADLVALLERTCGSAPPMHVDCPYTRHSSPLLRRLVWNGIPSACRPFLYQRLSGAFEKQQQAPQDYFTSMVHKASTLTEPVVAAEPEHALFTAARKQIQVDLQRTFAGHDCWTQSTEGQASLERVLLAYAAHNEQLGYCQSMTFIAGKLLCLHEHWRQPNEPLAAMEERVFWLLVVLCESFFPAYYTPGMCGLRADGIVLEWLVHKRLPKLARHLELLHSQHTGVLLASAWLLPLFCAVFPSETTFRLLDVLIWEGPSVMFSLALALLRIAQPELLEQSVDYMQVFGLLKERDACLYDTALLLEVAYEDHMVLVHEEDIDELRAQAAESLSDTDADATMY